jgi:hypothetical protein
MRNIFSCPLAPVLAATVVAACLAATPAHAVNLGDVPGNDGLQATCSKIAYLGPMITAWCTDKSDLTFKSAVDVRTCVDFLVVDDGTAHIRCKKRLRR